MILQTLTGPGGIVAFFPVSEAGSVMGVPSLGATVLTMTP